MIVAPLPNYNSFMSVAELRAYHAARGNTAFDQLEDAEVEPVLVRATDFISLNYTFTEEVVTDTVNPSLKMACAVLAGYALTEDLFGIRDEREVLETESELTGVGKERIKYASSRTGDRFPMVTAILGSVALASNSSVFVGRMVR